MRRLLYALFGFLNGYLLLHPASMVLFVFLAGRRHSVSPQQETLAVILSSFEPAMLPMALGFGLLGVVVSMLYETQSNRLAREGDRLRSEVVKRKALVAELENRTRQLDERRRELLDLQEMRERTIGFLVHDFKNQLGCIVGFTEMLLERARVNGDSGTRTLLIRIRRQAKAMTTSVRNLLDIARLEEEPSLKKGALSPAVLLESVATADHRSDGRFRTSIADATKECPPVLAEPELIRRVLMNLVGNAVKHQRPDVNITLGAAPDPTEQAVVFTCHDDGERISREIESHLFNRYRVGEKTPVDSTGLGLAFANAVVEAHGGRIWYESPREGGNSFRLAIPADPQTKE